MYVTVNGARLFFDVIGQKLAHIFGGDLAHVRASLPLNERRELEAWETFATLLGLTREFNRDAPL